MPIGTTQFPTSLDTSSSLVEVADNALTTLDGALDNSATTITVVSTSLFPSTGILTIDNEKISYTGKTSTTFTGCTRGVGGTSAASHLTAANVECLIVEEWHRVHSAAIIAIETKLGTGSAIAVNKLEALTASRLPVLDASGFLSASSVTATEAGYLSGVTSAIQTQLGNKQGLDATLTALAAYNTNGLLTQTAADTFTGRTLTGTSNRISVSNGDGVSGNPTVDISTSYVGQATITTLGTITTGTWNGSAIAAAYIGDLSAVYQPLDADLAAIAALSANGFLKKTAGTWGMDSSTYLTANQTITLSGDVSGSGTTAITATIGNGVVTNAMLAGSIAISKLNITGTPDGTKFLRDDGSWQAASGGGTPGGSDTQVQFNNSGAFGGSANFVYASSAVIFTRASVGSTSADGLVLQNTTAAADGAQQWSPRLRLSGKGWKTDSTAASQAVDWIQEVVPVQGTSVARSYTVWASQANGGGYTARMALTDTGMLRLGRASDLVHTPDYPTTMLAIVGPDVVGETSFYGPANIASIVSPSTDAGTWTHGGPINGLSVTIQYYWNGTGYDNALTAISGNTINNAYNALMVGVSGGSWSQNANGGFTRVGLYGWAAGQSSVRAVGVVGIAELAGGGTSMVGVYGAVGGSIAFDIKTAAIPHKACFSANINGTDGDILTGHDGSTDLYRITASGVTICRYTYTAGGTTGAQTINKPSGSVNFAAAATSLVVTNSLVTTNSIIFCVVQTNDATMQAACAVPASGSFTIYPNAAPTAETRVAWWVLNA